MKQRRRASARTRRAGWATAGLAAALALLAGPLISCSPNVTLRVEGGSPELRQTLARLAGDYARERRVKVSLSEPEAGPRRTEVAVAWRLAPERSAGLAPLANDRAPLATKGVSSALALRRWARTENGWTELPLLWDAWGVWGEAPDVAAAAPKGSFSWDDRRALAAKGLSLVAGGGDPGNAQALYWLIAAPESASPSDFAVDKAAWAAQPASSSFGLFASSLADRALFPASQHFGRGDQEQLARQVGRRVYLLPFSAQYRWTWGGAKAFAALVTRQGGQARLVASVLSARIEGGGRRDRRAAAGFILWLLDPARQRQLEEGTGLLPANFDAPNLNGTTKALRDLALAAESFQPVVEEASDEPARRWSSLVSSIVASPASWESLLRESLR